MTVSLIFQLLYLHNFLLLFWLFVQLGAMGRKLDPTYNVKRGPGRKAKKQQGAETELAKFITDGDYCVFFLKDITMIIQAVNFNENHFILPALTLLLVGLNVSLFLQRKLEQNACQVEAGKGERLSDYVILFLFLQVSNLFCHFTELRRESRMCKSLKVQQKKISRKVNTSVFLNVVFVVLIVTTRQLHKYVFFHLRLSHKKKQKTTQI